MASSPITSWQIHGGKVETVADFIFLGSKITADSDCSHEIKRHLLLGRKATTNLNTVFESRGDTYFTNYLREAFETLTLKSYDHPICTWSCKEFRFSMLKSTTGGTSLMIQGLRLCLATQRAKVPSFVRELRSHVPRASKSECHKYWAQPSQLETPCPAT